MAKKIIKNNKISISEPIYFNREVLNPIWLSISEAAKISGVTNKTIRRALQKNTIKYKIIKNRYFIDFSTVVRFLHTKTKLRNKFNQDGLGQYVEKWRN